MTVRILRDYSHGSSPLIPDSGFRADSRCRPAWDLSEKFFLDVRPRTDSPSPFTPSIDNQPSVADSYIDWELPGLLEWLSPLHQVRTPMVAGEENVSRQKLVNVHVLGSKVAPTPVGTASSLPG